MLQESTSDVLLQSTRLRIMASCMFEVHRFGEGCLGSTNTSLEDPGRRVLEGMKPAIMPTFPVDILELDLEDTTLLGAVDRH